METPETNNSQVYKHEFQEGLTIFERSFEGYQHSKFEAQKSEYDKAMHESLTEMRDAASGMFNQKINQLREQLETSVDQYTAHPTRENQEKVEDTLDEIKNQL